MANDTYSNETVPTTGRSSRFHRVSYSTSTSQHWTSLAMRHTGHAQDHPYPEPADTYLDRISLIFCHRTIIAVYSRSHRNNDRDKIKLPILGLEPIEIEGIHHRLRIRLLQEPNKRSCNALTHSISSIDIVPDGLVSCSSFQMAMAQAQRAFYPRKSILERRVNFVARP